MCSSDLGQLEAELDRDAWFVVDRHEDDAFCERPETLWRDVLRRQRGPMAMFAHHPEDPDVN